ncbi:MAG: hypothetical protein AAGH78_17860 [Cyanobacteria bacterium P01_H01_bin.58]
MSLVQASVSGLTVRWSGEWDTLAKHHKVICRYSTQPLARPRKCMEIGHTTLRDRIVSALSNASSALPFVLAGWEGGSAAFDLVDEYSDIDLNFLLDGANAEEPFYATVQSALEEVSPSVASHSEPPGRYSASTLDSKH